MNDNFLKNVIKINQLYQLYKHLYQKIIKSIHYAWRHRVDWEYGPFLTVYHVKHSELYNEPIVYQIKSAGGILIKLRESPDIIHVRLEKKKKRKKVLLGSTAKPSKSNLENAENLLLYHFTLLSMLPLYFWSTLFYISTILKDNYILLDCNLLFSLNTLWKCHYIFYKPAVSSFEYNYKAAIWDNEYFSSSTGI